MDNPPSYGGGSCWTSKSPILRGLLLLDIKIPHLTGAAPVGHLHDSPILQGRHDSHHGVSAKCLTAEQLLPSMHVRGPSMVWARPGPAPYITNRPCSSYISIASRKPLILHKKAHIPPIYASRQHHLLFLLFRLRLLRLLYILDHSVGCRTSTASSRPERWLPGLHRKFATTVLITGPQPRVPDPVLAAGPQPYVK